MLTAWYPLYPLVVHVASTVSGLDRTLAGTLLSLLFTAVSYVVLYQVVRDYGTHQISWITVILIALFPTAFFFFSVYSEALFLLLSVLTYALAHREALDLG